MNKIEAFGEINGQVIQRLSVTNAHGVTLSCLTYAALWYSLEVPVHGQMRNLIVNSPSVADYVDAPSYLGKAIGRTGGRIAKGTYQAGTQTIHLPTNEGDNTLHGGPNGFHSVVWAGEVDNNVIRFTHRFASQADGFPGDLAATVTYTLTADDQVLIDFDATSTQDTLFNPTSHVYFNLNAADHDVANHELYINSNERLTLDQEKLPTGELTPVGRSPYAFNLAHLLAETFTALANTPENGIDDVYVIPDHAPETPIAILSLDDVCVSLYSDRNGLVLYTGNSFDGSGHFVDRVGRPHMGIALEAQTLPNAVSDPRFGSITLAADTPKHEQIRYQIAFAR